MGFIDQGDHPPLVPLTGGVSSEIYRLDLADGPICIKRALAKLKVEQDWFAPVERSAYEVAFIRTVEGIAPGTVPRVLGYDPDALAIVMAYLDPADYPVWKDQLRDGHVDSATATALGALLAKIHGATAGDRDVQATFDGSAPVFFDLRIESYLLATARAQPSVAPILQNIAATTQATNLTLVHGDFSPKNILVGPDGPVVLDSETANYGDPSFDLAFCLNHLLLKCIWKPQWTAEYLACFDALATTYLDRVTWEDSAALDARAAALLSAFLLARIDGKSPVEYITTESDRDFVRQVAMGLLSDLPDSVTRVRQVWQDSLAGR